MKNLILYILVGFHSYGFAQSVLENDTIIIWSKSRILEYKDFRITVRDSINNPFTAGLNSQILIKPNEFYDDNFENVIFIAIARPYLSYMFLERAKILEHEQVHFNITEYNARLMRKRLENFKQECVNDCITKLEEIYREGIIALTKLQNEYDQDTQHGWNKEKQLFWNLWIAEKLEETIEFERDYSLEDLK